MGRVKHFSGGVLRRTRRVYRQVRPQKVYDSAYNLKFTVRSSSDSYVYGEIFGPEDAYRRDTLAPIMRGGTVIEIGAHKGFFTALASRSAARVIALEPDAENYSYLCRNLEANAVGNVVAVNKAVSDREGPRTFWSGKTAARHTLFRSQFSGRGSSITVDCTTLPALLRDFSIEHVNLLKIDCEGSEYDILFSCDASVFDKVSVIAMEMHETEGIPYTKDRLIQFLEQFGFTTEVYDERVMETMRLWMAYSTKAHPTAEALAAPTPGQVRRA